MKDHRVSIGLGIRPDGRTSYGPGCSCGWYVLWGDWEDRAVAVAVGQEHLRQWREDPHFADADRVEGGSQGFCKCGWRGEMCDTGLAENVLRPRAEADAHVLGVNAMSKKHSRTL